jgi:hypothetical protein
MGTTANGTIAINSLKEHAPMQTTTLDTYGEREKSISTILAGRARLTPVLHVEILITPSRC